MRCLPPVSDWGRQFVEPDPEDVAYEEVQRQVPAAGPSLMDRVSDERIKHRTCEQTYRSSKRWNCWSGFAYFLLWWCRVTSAPCSGCSA